jgi:hypothetical protein
MVAPIKATKKVALGRDTWWIIPALASATSPAVTDINAAGGLNVSGFVLGEQEGFSSDTGKTALPRLLIETSVTETLEPTTFSIPTFRFALDPQAAAGANDKKAWALLKDGFTGFIVRRQNIVNSISDAAVAGQFVDNAPIIGSVGTPKVTGTGADAIYVFDVDFGITGIPTFNVACV